jgi:tetratricopeptide (TPR) repeat protein
VIHDLLAQTWAYFANCNRIRSDFRGAEKQFQVAELHLQRGTGDPMLRAEVCDLHASCCRVQQRFQEAIDLLHQAASAYAETGDHHRVARALFSKTLVYFEMDQPQKSFELLERVIPMIDTQREPRLAVNIQHQRMLTLHQAGRNQEALVLLPQAREVAEHYGSRLDRLRLTGIEGLITAELGDLERAERCLVHAREGFVSEGIGYDAALFSLDLAALYLSQGRTAETRQLAVEIIPIFASRDIHREALAALMIFQRAAELETSNLAMVKEISRFLRRARNNPNLQFKPQG